MSNHEYVVYHNTEGMGYEFEGGPTWSVVTRKNFCKEAKGRPIWVIVGVGKPRRYTLNARFVAENIDRLEDEEGSGRFTWRLYGETGFNLEPVELNREVWFRQFLNSMQNFSLGFSRIPSEFMDEFHKHV